jgi:tRNA modification GTPase
LRALFSNGVRQAQAGEFTKRAFLNGRLDLTQAEAVIDLIEAETPAVAQNAAGQLLGAVGLKLEPIYNSLLDVLAHFHAVIDYPDEDINEFRIQSYLPLLGAARDELSRMLSTHERGRVLREGVPTVIIGRPNTGKSSLLNALLGYDRAIVTSIAGTTRDTIEEKILIGGVLLRLTDTAGVRKTDDAIEKLGVARTLAAVRGAGFVILVLDGSEPLRDEDSDALRLIPRGVPALAVVNKSDLPAVLNAEDLSGLGLEYCDICSITGEGLSVLETKVRVLFPELETPPTGEIITNARQADAISRSLDSVNQAIDAINASITPDAVLGELESALAVIGEITGKTMREDIVSRIFERFCVGK